MLGEEREKWFIRDIFLPLGDLERVCVPADVDRSASTAHLAAYGAHAELIRHGRAGLDCESHCSAVAASLELDWHGSLHGEVSGALFRCNGAWH